VLSGEALGQATVPFLAELPGTMPFCQPYNTTKPPFLLDAFPTIPIRFMYTARGGSWGLVGIHNQP